jgi:hypothetical protein
MITIEITRIDSITVKLARLSQLTTRFSEFSRFDGCKRLIFLHAHPEKGL